jgi:hypothetical protein
MYLITLALCAARDNSHNGYFYYLHGDFGYQKYVALSAR